MAGLDPIIRRSEQEIRLRIQEYIEQRPDLDLAVFRNLSWPMLCVWCAVEWTYELEGVGPTGPLGFTLDDFATNLETFFPEAGERLGADFVRNLLEQYLSMIEHIAGDRGQSAWVAGRLDQAVDDLIRSDLTSAELN